MTISERFEGCILGGAIGDAYGSGYENIPEESDSVYYLNGKPEKKEPKWRITDDTQLTLVTCEGLIKDETANPKIIANEYVKLYRRKRLTGIGSSTLKSLRELDLGAAWSQAGRRGEYGAGNGAAMRIAPIAFIERITKERIREICYITHANEEAYIGAYCIVLSIREILKGNWTGNENLLELIINQIPDTRVRDRLIEINKIQDNSTLLEIGRLGKNGYVVNSIPLALAAVNKIDKLGIETVYMKLIEIGGDTDTNCSIAGQIMGTLIGRNKIPDHLKNKLKNLNSYNWIEEVLEKVERRKYWA